MMIPDSGNWFLGHPVEPSRNTVGE